MRAVPAPTKRHVMRVARSLGLEVIVVGGDTLTIVAPAGHHWAGGNHGLVEHSVERGARPAAWLWQNTAERLQEEIPHLEPCTPATCEAWDRGACQYRTA